MKSLCDLRVCFFYLRMHDFKLSFTDLTYYLSIVNAIVTQNFINSFVVSLVKFFYFFILQVKKLDL